MFAGPYARSTQAARPWLVSNPVPVCPSAATPTTALHGAVLDQQRRRQARIYSKNPASFCRPERAFFARLSRRYQQRPSIARSDRCRCDADLENLCRRKIAPECRLPECRPPKCCPPATPETKPPSGLERSLQACLDIPTRLPTCSSGQNGPLTRGSPPWSS
jgi:hypothetical protein